MRDANIDVYDALKLAGAGDDLARRAATAISGRGACRRIDRIESRIAVIEAQLSMHRLVFGLIIALQIGILVSALLILEGKWLI